MSEFIIPPNQITESENPVVFLAGPVQGARNWQARVGADLLSQSLTDITVVSPRGNPPLYAPTSYWMSEGLQTPWEKHHLKLARDQGVLAVWMAEQIYETPGRVYAQTSRIEFGRIAGWLDYNPAISFVFGVDPKYKGGNQTYMEEVCGDLNIQIARNFGAFTTQILERLYS